MPKAEASLVSPVSAEEALRAQELLSTNLPLKKAFERYQATHSSLDLVVNLSLGQIPASDRELLREACRQHLGPSAQNGLTMDEVLAALRNAGYYHCIGKIPIEATVQLISVNHEVRDREFVLRYRRVLDS